MNCEMILERLDDYLDGELDPRETEQVRTHLDCCAACHREHRALVRLLERAVELRRDEEPPRDLWDGIRSRIAAPAAVNRSGSRLWVLAAAAVLFFAALFGPQLLQRSGRPDNGFATASGSVAPAVATPVSYQEADERFAEVRERLLADMESGEDRLGPETVRVVRKHLKVMDDAAAEIRKALAADPGNPGLRRMLMASYRHETKLLTRIREYPETM